ncbi:hypothetical protein Y1Q_0024176 [Alligator mississippiensis]|uniref:Uncharacterized protein n=1 Tax=Alligator mississippiensis TaxID=8496 RepID=A0A151NHZ2_ALLMI|nr:hypothetical protein Y1Q_0024176 [Alligator mississippiensis]
MMQPSRASYASQIFLLHCEEVEQGGSQSLIHVYGACQGSWPFCVEKKRTKSADPTFFVGPAQNHDFHENHNFREKHKIVILCHTSTQAAAEKLQNSPRLSLLLFYGIWILSS